VRVTIYAKSGDIISCKSGIGLVLSTFVIRHAGLVGNVFINGKVKKINLSHEPNAIAILSSLDEVEYESLSVHKKTV
jgi:hypothetical protein